MNKMNYLVFAIMFFLVERVIIADEPKEYKIKISEEVLKQLNISQELKMLLDSGDIVGNGGGILEQNFRYVYRKLPTYIKKCTTSNVCPLNENYQDLLRQMIPLINENIKNKDALIFISERKYPGFFTDKSDPEQRTAKTAFIKGSPLFINLDMVNYSSVASDVVSGSHLSFTEIAGIIVHELGHQLGILSHSTLDELSAQFRAVIAGSQIENSTNIFGNELGIDIYNFNNDDAQKSLIELKLNSEYFSVQQLIDKELKCEKGNVFGYKIVNTHWERPNILDAANLNINFEGWINYFCMDDKGLLWDYSKDLIIILSFETYIQDSITLMKLTSSKVEIR